MGLRFRKSITLCKGVRLNFGKTGMSVTTGMRGYHNTYNFGTGRTTTSIGIPGTGISYVTTSGGRHSSQQSSPRQPRSTPNRNNEIQGTNYPRESISAPPQRSGHVQAKESYIPDDAFVRTERTNTERAIPVEKIKTIHYSADEVIDWTELLVSDQPDTSWENIDLWNYLHDKAYDVLNGDIDTYLEIIQSVNPLDDLLDYGIGFECGTDDPNIMTVEFTTKQDQLVDRRSLSSDKYHDLVQDYICSCSIRIARDIFALLPVANVVVNALSERGTLLSVNFDRRVFTKLKFQGTDASDLVAKFTHNMDFDLHTGFRIVTKLYGD